VAARAWLAAAAIAELPAPICSVKKKELVYHSIEDKKVTGSPIIGQLKIRRLLFIFEATFKSFFKDKKL
jgi:hypothetical protein